MGILRKESQYSFNQAQRRRYNLRRPRKFYTVTAMAAVACVLLLHVFLVFSTIISPHHDDDVVAVVVNALAPPILVTPRHRRRTHSPHSFGTVLDSAKFAVPTATARATARAATYTTTTTDMDLGIVEALEELYPSTDLDKRIALSRKDGYWPWISKGEDPPSALVYGEFDLHFFAHVLDRAGECMMMKMSSSNMSDERNNNKNKIIINKDESVWKDKVFCDLGSGTGRLVLAAAALHPWKLCRGVELLRGIHEEAEAILKQCEDSYGSTRAYSLPRSTNSDSTTATTTATTSSSSTTPSSSSPLSPIQAAYFNPDTTSGHLAVAFPSPSSSSSSSYSSATNSIPLAPIDLECGSFEDPYQFFGDADLIFVFSSCMNEHNLISLARSIGRQCQSGCLVLTTEYQLPVGTMQLDALPDDPDVPHGTFSLELVESMTGPNMATGGDSTVFVHRLTQGLGDGQRRTPPILPVSEMAYRAVVAAEDLTVNDSNDFVRRVSNQMAFIGLPHSWRPASTISDHDMEDIDDDIVEDGMV